MLASDAISSTDDSVDLLSITSVVDNASFCSLSIRTLRRMLRRWRRSLAASCFGDFSTVALGSATLASATLVSLTGNALSTLSALGLFLALSS